MKNSSKLSREKNGRESIYRKYCRRVRDTKDIVKWFNLNGIGIPENKRKKLKEAIFENIIIKNFPN